MGSAKLFFLDRAGEAVDCACFFLFLVVARALVEAGREDARLVLLGLRGLLEDVGLEVELLLLVEVNTCQRSG